VPFVFLEATAEAAAFLTGTGPLEAKVDLTPGFLEAAAEGAGAVLEDRGFLDANGEALDEVVVAADAGLDVAALRADAAAVVRLASGAREAVGAGLVDEDAVEAAGFVVVLADRGALAVVVPFVLAEVVVLAGEAVRADAVDLTAVVGAAFLSARPGRVVAPGVGLFWVMGDALAAVGAGLDEGPVRVDPVGPLPAVVLGAVGLDVAVAEPVAGLVGLVAAVDAAVLLAGVALLVVAEEGLDEVVEGAPGFLAAPTPGRAPAPVVLGVVDLDELPVGAGLAPTREVAAPAVLGAETGLELVGLVVAGADLSPGFLAGPVDPATGFLAGLALVTAAAVAPATVAPTAAAATTATTSLVSAFGVSSGAMGSRGFSTVGSSDTTGSSTFAGSSATTGSWTCTGSWATTGSSTFEGSSAMTGSSTLAGSSTTTGSSTFTGSST